MKTDAMDLIRDVAEDPDASLDEIGMAFMRLALAKGAIDPASFDMDGAAKCLEAIAAIKVAGGGSGQDEILRSWVAIAPAHQLAASRTPSRRSVEAEADPDSAGAPDRDSDHNRSVEGEGSGLGDQGIDGEPGDGAAVLAGSAR